MTSFNQPPRNEYVTSPDPSSLLGGTWTYTKTINGSNYDSLFTTDSLNPDYSVSFGGGGDALGGSINQSFNATAGSIYIASLDVGYIGYRESVGVRFSILDRNNEDQVDSYIDVSTSSINFPTVVGTFTTYSFQFTAPSTNLAFKVQDISAYGPSTDVLINSASVVAVPEPSTYTLLASGILIVFWTFLRRRRTSCSSSH
jgi:hypothetical protein